MLPCVGQAAIGIEVKEGNLAWRPCCRRSTILKRICASPRAGFSGRDGRGCQLAVAALAEITEGLMRLRAVSFLGEKPRRGEINGLLVKPPVGQELAARVL